jgi:hypothetical protein
MTTASNTARFSFGSILISFVAKDETVTMAAPQTIQIPHDDYHFEYVGTFGDGCQFMGFLTYASPKYYWKEEAPSGDQPVWRQYTNSFAVLHRFDTDGNHIGADVRRVGGTPDSEDADSAVFGEMIAGLGPHGYRDIHVKLFSVPVDGVTHGLVYEMSEPDEAGEQSEWVMLEPRDIMFHPPWDSGEYST